MKTILYVEDDPDDLLLFREALTAVDPTIKLIEHFEGKETLDYLSRHLHNLPALIILDLNMPGMNGQEFLKTIKAHEQFSSIPVIIFTTSEYHYDRDYCQQYTEHYIKKPMEFSLLAKEVAHIVAIYKREHSQSN